ncbi:MAG TPA: sigma-54 dependent transcriptional regulator [Kofleriaceae bacterium]|nr:sigma-54 dependent transcriptional regulator [Kofleriaceae bacterium]
MAIILIIDDNETIRDGLAHTIKKMGHRAIVASGGEDGIALVKKRGDIDFVITDLRMDGLDGVGVLARISELCPDVPTMIITAYGTVDTAVTAMKLGAFDFLTKPFSPEVVRLKVERALELCSERRARRRLEGHNEYLQHEADAHHAVAEIIGDSDPIQNVIHMIGRVARAGSSVLITGESGTGKELCARAIHKLSERADGPFIQINCGAIVDTLLESELFGHERGAFTGAIKTKLGRFELACGGTLFLDEIGDVPPAMQVKLLRALQEQEIQRVGGEATIRIDTRVISATNKDLEDEVKSGRFREDLYYRLHVVPITMPPLRDRRSDVPMLVNHFIAKLGPRVNPRVTAIDDDALGLLVAHPWPGNVRELENTIEQALVFADGPTITRDALPPRVRAGDVATTVDVPRQKALPDILDDLERQLIIKAFREAGGVKTETARLLGIKPSALYYKLDKYGIS